MTIREKLLSPWTRKHDDPRMSLIEEAARIVYPETLADVIALCSVPGQQLKPAGRHWALSEAAQSDHTFIETNDPNEQFTPMAKTLPDVVPSCLTPEYLDHLVNYKARNDERHSLIHVEAGKRIFQLYSELDEKVDLTNDRTLGGYIKRRYSGREDFGGRWAPYTLGGAGGQTIVGAFSTGTHGGDFDRPPIADSVLALHLVVDGGHQYWIEPSDSQTPKMTSDDKLRGVYEKFGPFSVVRDSDIFNAALVSVGRFGVIYSVVIKAAPQYSLYERRRLAIWQDIRTTISNRGGDLFNETPSFTGLEYQPSSKTLKLQRFLQIGICLAPTANGKQNQVGITKRWDLSPPEVPGGRAERVGGRLKDFSAWTGGPLFEFAGASSGYDPDPDGSLKGENPSMLEIACANGNWLAGVISGVEAEIIDFVESNGVVVGVGIAAVGAVGGMSLIAAIPALFAVLAILKALLELFDNDVRFSEIMNAAKDALLDPNETDPLRRLAGVLAWRMIYNKGFESQQSNRDYEAVSYAVMDGHNYTQVSCDKNVDSIEVFFNSAGDELITFVDALCAFEAEQEFSGKSCVGYASLRFTGPTRALIGMQRFETSCSVEVSSLLDVTGGQELIDFAAAFARQHDIRGIFHWGQRNDWVREETEYFYGPTQSDPIGRLAPWRKALSVFTENGRKSAFSSEFTRRVGLEA